MSKLHKKCFIASAGMHGLLFLVLLVGPAFLMSRDKPDDMPILDFIPAKLIDEQFSRQSAPTPEPRPAPPQPQVKRAEPVKPKPVKTPEPEPVKPKPAPKVETGGWKPTKVDISTSTRKRNPNPKPKTTQPRPNYSAAASAIRKATSTTTIEMPSMPAGGGQAYANYAQAVKSIYDRNWFPPAETTRDDALVKVKIVIARDGTVLSSAIISRSGDSAVDGTVGATLRRVTKVPAFPAGAKESKRTYTLGFNLKAKRALG